MAITKKASISLQTDLYPLNKPNWPEYNLKRIKTASIQKNKETDLGGFDIESAISKNPDNLFVKVFAIKKDEVNDNADAFSEAELIKATDSFVGVPVFCNHQNDDIEKARGVVAHAWYDKERGGIYIIARVDRVAYPKLARGIEEGIIVGTSMGASRGFDLTLMSDGTQKRVDELQTGDEVITHNGNKEKITAVCKTQEHSELYDITWNGGSNLALSHEHPLLILSYEDVYFSSKSDKKYRKNTKDINETVEPVFREASLVKPGDYVLEYINQEEKDIGIDEDMAFVLGVYAAEGYISEKSVGFCFGLDEESKEDGNFVKLAKILQKKYPDCHVRIDKNLDRNGLYLVTWNEDLAKKCKQYIGCGSHNKSIHTDLLVMSTEKQKIFLAGYLDGDGCIVKQRQLSSGYSSGQGAMQASSASKELLFGIRKMCLRLETPSTLSSHDRVASSSTVVDNDKRYIEHMLYITNTISEKIEKYSWKAKNNKKALKPKYDSFFYKDYIAHRIKTVDIIDNNEDTYYVQIGENGDENSDHSYILNDIATHNCSVEYSVCSICHTRAATADEYCDHVKFRKNKKFSGKVTCQYHKSNPDTEDPCPVCGAKAGKKNTFELKDAHTYEHNFGIKFIEDSFVVNPACHDCLVAEIFNTQEFEKKVASLRANLTKLSSTNCSTGACNINSVQKTAGKQELDNLTTVMDILEKVAKSMMSQKAQVSMEYVSDVVETLASLQGLTDELMEMGYGQLPSPQLTGAEDIELPKSGEEVATETNQPLPETPTMKPTQPSISDVSQEQSDLGSVVMPKMSEKKKEFIHHSAILIDRLQKITHILENSVDHKESEMTQDKNTESMEKVASQDVVTEKQLADAAGTGERWDSAPEVVTEKQLDKPNENKPAGLVGSLQSPQERVGAPEVITEKQFESVTATCVTWANELPDVITEKQWNDVSRMIGSELNKSQDDIVTEKQLADFLGNHRYTAPEIVTEKQLDKKAYTLDGQAVVKTAMEAMSDAIAIFGKTPSEIAKVASFINDNPRNFDKAALTVLINAAPYKVYARSAEKDKAAYFAKLASKQSSIDALDAVLLSISEHLGYLSADDVLQGIKHVASNQKGMKQVEAMAKSKMHAEPTYETVIDKTAAFDAAIDALDRPEDGMYQIKATVEEIGADPTDKSAFVQAAHKFATAQINDSDVETAIVNIDMDEEKGLVVATVKDVNALTEDEKTSYAKFVDLRDKAKQDAFVDMVGEEDGIADAPSAQTIDSLEDEQQEEPLLNVASSREEMVKEAQMLGGEMGGQGGVSQAPGAGATLPAAPAGPEAGLESFEGSDLGDEFAVEEEEDLSAKPPGSICCVCGSSDVDIIKGTGKCNGCSAEFEFKVSIDVTKWPGTLPDAQDNGDESVEESGIEGEGFELPEAGAAPVADDNAGLPAAASVENDKVEKLAFAAMTKITPKIAEYLKENEIQIGSVSPLTGSASSMSLGNNEHVCLDTGLGYKIAFAVDPKNPKAIYAQWEWTPKTAQEECTSCSRQAQAFVKALESYGLSEQKFDALSTKDKGNTIVAMKEAGLFKAIKTASVKSGSTLDEYKKSFAQIKEFPVDICKEKIARRYGKDAVALSGPFEGQNLADCICNSLKQANVYSNDLAIKVAGIWCDKDGSEECLEDFVRGGFSIRQSSTICESIKLRHAQFDDMIADDLGNLDDDTDPDDGPEGTPVDEPCCEEDIDPFEDSVSVDMPSDVADALLGPAAELVSNLADALGIESDVVIGGEEKSEEVSDLDVDVEIDVPEDVSEIVEDAEEVVDDVEDAADDIVEEVTDEAIDESPEDEDSFGEEEKEESFVEDIDECKCMDEGDKIDKIREICENNEGSTEEDIEEDNKEYKEGEPEKDCVASEEQENVRESHYMNRGHINKTNEINMDLSSVLDAIKQASDVGVETAQDAAQAADATFSGKATIGDEDSFTADKAKPFTGKATIGEEDSDAKPKDKADVFTGDAKMGDEELDSELTDKATGGDDGQGKSTKAQTDGLVERIAEAMDKKADKVNRKQVQDDEDLKPNSGDSFIGNEKESIGDVPEAKTTPEGTPQDDQFIKNEKESIGDKPSEKDMPEIPTKDDRIKGEKDNDVLTPEKDNEMTGKVQGGATANSGEEFQTRKEAFRIAGRMLQEGMIQADTLGEKVEELSSYKIAQLQDIETSMFAKKGLTASSDGVEGGAVIVSEESSEKAAQDRNVDPQTELTTKLQSLFSLNKRIITAQEDNDIQTRKIYGR